MKKVYQKPFVRGIGMMLIAALLFFGAVPAWADGEGSSTTPAPAPEKPLATVSLTLEEALALGIKNNVQISLAELSVETAAINVSQAEAAAKRTQKLVDEGKEPGSYRIPFTADIYQAIHIFPAQAELGQELTVLSRDYTRQSIQYGIQAAYYGLQKAEKALTVNRVAMRRSETQLKNSQAREKQGLSPRLDVISAESNYLMAQAAYEQGRNYVFSARMQLNQMLGLDINTPLIVKEELSFAPAEEIQLEEAIRKAKETDLTYGLAKNAYENAALMKDFDQKYNDPITYVYQKAEISYLEAKEKMEDAAVSLEIKLREAYGDLQTAQLNYKSLETSVALAAEALRLADLRYQEGMATVYDVQEADAAYQQAEMGLLNAIHTHNLAKAAFEYQIYGAFGGY